MPGGVGEIWIVVAVVLVPLLGAVLSAVPATRSLAPLVVVVSVVPALAAGLVLGDSAGVLTWLGSGAQIVLNESSRAFLVLTAFIWAVGGAYAYATVHEGRARFFGFFAFAMTGNLGLSVAADPATFYTFFSMMALATYVLVVHRGARHSVEESRRAGRVYMAFTLVGEATLLSGLLLLFAGGSAFVVAGTALVLVAFGVKIGAPGVHGWMPVAYGAAPPAVAAVLAGSMSTSGVLGIARFVPGTEVSGGWIAVTVMTFGLVAAFGGAVVGIVQRTPATTLAYSSVSQFGLMMVAVGAGLTSPALWPKALAAVTLYAVHHGVAKAALFIGADLVSRAHRRSVLLAALAIPALALAGAPLTSGAIAKVALKGVTGELSGAWHDVLAIALPVAAIGTTALMIRFMYLTGRVPLSDERPARHPTMAAIAWGVATAAVVGAVWVWAGAAFGPYAAGSLRLEYVWQLGWPIVSGVLLAVGFWLVRDRVAVLVGAIPPGDVYSPVFKAVHHWVEASERAVAAAPPSAVSAVSPASDAAPCYLERVGRLERLLLGWTAAAATFAILAVWLLLLAR